MSRRLLLAVLPLLAGACSDAAAHADRDGAMAAFAEFQRALLAGDRPALDRILTTGSRPVFEQVDLARFRAQQPLQALGVTAHDYEHWIRVRDPNQGDAESTFVVAREHGAWRVDLVATAGHHAVTVPKTGPLEFEETPLTPAQIGEIRARAAAAVR